MPLPLVVTTPSWKQLQLFNGCLANHSCLSMGNFAIYRRGCPPDCRKAERTSECGRRCLLSAWLNLPVGRRTLPWPSRKQFGVRTMTKGRLEAFTDGVVAIIITIMVLEMKVPHGGGIEALQASVPIFLAYVLSYINIGIFWTNHHHMLHATDRVDGRVLWANLFLLFWLSLVPFVIRWI